MIVWEGNSEIDGAPIVAIATVGSKNPKTGDMVQVWIIRSDIAPHEAVKRGDDRSICGDCPQRHFLGGACYVTPFQAPLAVYRRYASGGYSDPKWIAKVRRALVENPIRLGAYGDPAAVPFHVWESLIAQGCGKWTGYTHQWRKCDPRYREILMASCDNKREAEIARGKGWRFFLVVDGEAPAIVRDKDRTVAVECLSDARNMSCEDCGICDGTRADSRGQAVSVVIGVHGARSKRFALHVVR